MTLSLSKKLPRLLKVMSHKISKKKSPGMKERDAKEGRAVMTVVRDNQTSPVMKREQR